MTKSKQELGKMTKQELCDYCRKHGIKGYSGKTKAQRVDLINKYYKSEKQPAKKQISRPEVKGKSEKQQVKEIIHNLRNKKYKEILISDDPDFSTYKCNACGLIDFPSKFAVIGNKRILCKKCEAKISKLQYKSLWDKPKSTKRLGIYLYGESIRSEGIGNVSYIIATTSKSKAVARIKEVETQRVSKNWISQRISPLDDTIPTDLRKVKGFDPLSTPEVLYMFETSKMVGSSVTHMEIPKLIKKWKGSVVAKKQQPKKKSEIKWKNIDKKWRDTSVQFGITKNGNKLKAYILRTEYPKHFVYTVKFSIYSPEKKKWLDYSEHRLEVPKDQKERKVIELINSIAFDIKNR